MKPSRTALSETAAGYLFLAPFLLVFGVFTLWPLLVALWLSLLIDHGGWLKEPLRPAAPTLDAAQILDLVRLR